MGGISGTVTGRMTSMIILFKDVGYHMIWDKAGFLSYQFFHWHMELLDAIVELQPITEEGKCVYCKKFIAPYKKLEVMVKLKEFTEGR